MEKNKYYKNVFFPVEVIKEACELFDKLVAPEKKENVSLELDIEKGSVSWKHDNEAEFFSDYRNEPTQVDYWRSYEREKRTVAPRLRIFFINNVSSVTVRLNSREEIEKIFAVFEMHEEKSKIPPKPEEPPTIFIGHGHSPQWIELKDHLHEKHDYKIEAYEIGARAGHTIRDILERMLISSSLAFLVMTGEDETADGRIIARPNVIHEAGLFQGMLGFHRAIILLEEGTEAFSNIQGIQQIRFGKDNIKETFGEVLATLRREFGR